jgi:PAS domain S-box-containing protein
MAGEDVERGGATLRDADFAALADASPDFIFAKDRDYRFLYANRTYAAFLGVSPALLIGRRDADFIQPSADAGSGPGSFRALDDEVLAGATVGTRRVSARHAGRVLHFDVVKQPVRDAHGEVYGVLTHARDVTAVLRAEDALRESEARYRTLLEHAPVGMYVHDGAQIRFANRAFAALMGAAEPAALLGYPVIEIAHPEERARLRERLRAIAEGAVATPTVDFRAVALDGGIKHVRVMATTCRYEGQPAVQVVIIDETERRAAEVARAALEAQLLHAQRLDALGTLAGGVAHDFNNLLAVIQVNADLAKRGLAAGHASREALDDVLVATAHAGELVRGILAFSRKQPLARQPLHLTDSVQEAVRLVRTMLPPSIALVVVPGADDAWVLADPTQVQQVLVNLCTNAWHAIGGDRPGEIRIAIEAVHLDDAGARAHPELRAGRYVSITVRDDGAGMDADTLARAFDPFFTTKGTGHGTGLGLSVVHGIMRGHGGAVTASSGLERGTELRLYFPVSDADLPAIAAADDAPRGVAPRRARVLVVDDVPAMQSVILRALGHLALDGVAHGSVAAAMVALRGAPEAWDLLVTDFNMPGASGLDLAREVKTVRPDLPVILISGYLDDGVRAAALELGVRALLAKPFTIEELEAAVGAALPARSRA